MKERENFAIANYIQETITTAATTTTHTLKKKKAKQLREMESLIRFVFA